MVHCPSPWEMSSWERFLFRSTYNYTHFAGINLRKERLFLIFQSKSEFISQILLAYSEEYFLFSSFFSALTRESSYLLTPWCRILLEKLTGLQLVKKFPAFHGTRRLIIVLTSVRQLSLSWASPIPSIYLHHISWRSVLILSKRQLILSRKVLSLLYVRPN